MEHLEQDYLTIANNVPKVYESGWKKVLDNAESLKGTLSGKAVSANDVISIEHNIPCQLTSDTITDFSQVEVSRYGKNFLDISSIIGTTVSAYGGTLTCGIDGGITGSGTPTSSVAFLAFRLYLPKGIYTLSRSGTFTNIACVLYLRDADGKSLVSFGLNDKPYGSKQTFNIADYPTYSYSTIEIKRSDNNIEISGTAYFQLEVGNTATTYEPFKEPTTYFVNPDGIVDGITSIAPNMTLLTNVDSVIINANYYKDPDIVISNLAQNVALTGGE